MCSISIFVYTFPLKYLKNVTRRCTEWATVATIGLRGKWARWENGVVLRGSRKSCRNALFIVKSPPPMHVQSYLSIFAPYRFSIDGEHSKLQLLWSLPYCSFNKLQKKITKFHSFVNSFCHYHFIIVISNVHQILGWKT